MGDLSFHFNHRDFACRCKECEGEYRINLSLVGALELLAENFKRPVQIVEGFRCSKCIEKMAASPKSKHAQGKAANIVVEGIPLPEVYKFAATIPEVKGLGFYPDKGFIHIDVRKDDKKDEKKEWISEGGRVSIMTPDKKRQFGL